MKPLHMPNFFPGFVPPTILGRVFAKPDAAGTIQVNLTTGETATHDFKTAAAAQQWLENFAKEYEDATVVVVQSPGVLR